MSDEVKHYIRLAGDGYGGLIPVPICGAPEGGGCTNGFWDGVTCPACLELRP